MYFSWSKWKEEKRVKLKFSFQSSIQPDLRYCSSPIEFYHLFLNDGVLELIIHENNRNVNNSLQKKTPIQWCNMSIIVYQPVQHEELLKLIGCILWMGLVHMPKIRDYWYTNPLFANNVASNVLITAIGLLTKYPVTNS